MLANDGGGKGRTLTNVSSTKYKAGVTWDAKSNVTYDPTVPTGQLQGLDDGESIVDTFTYTFKGSNGKTDTITSYILVRGVNDAPVGKTESVTTPEDTPITIDVLANDTDVDGELDPLTITNLVKPAHGTVSVVSGKVLYTPDTNYSGADSFTYTPYDGTAAGVPVTVTLTVTSANDPASISGDLAKSVHEMAQVSGTVTVTDVDTGENKFKAITDATKLVGQYGTFTFNETSGAWTYTADKADGMAAGASFVEKLTVTSLDGTATKTIEVTVHGTDDTPVAQDVTGTGDEDQPTILIDLSSKVSDIDGDALTIFLEPPLDPAVGTASVSGKVVTFTPAPNYNGTAIINYRVWDGKDGSQSSDTGVISVTVTPVNDLPSATPLTVSTDEDNQLPIILAGSDPEGSALTYVVASQPANGTLSGTGANLIYTPNADFSGSDSFTYKVNDGTDDSATATVSITVNAVNDTPTADAKEVTTNEDAAVSVTLSGSDKEGAALTYAVASQPTNGTLSGTGANLIYTPNGNYSGPDSFTYTVSDGVNTSVAAIVSIGVTAQNDSPVAVADSYETQEDTALNIAAAAGVLANDTDPETDALSAAVVQTVAHGTLALNPNGSFTYTPTANYSGLDSFTYKVNDGTADGNTVTVDLTVNPTNDAPIPDGPLRMITQEDERVTVHLFAIDPDVGDSVETYRILSLPENGTLYHDFAFTVPVKVGDTTVPNFWDGSSMLVFKPDANFNGQTTFTFVANDGERDSSVGTYTVIVEPVNDAPVFTWAGSTDVEENYTGVIATLTAEDVDLPAGQTLSWSLPADSPTNDNNVFSINPTTGELSLTQAQDFETRGDGGDNRLSAYVEVSDGDKITGQEIIFHVQNVEENRAPVAAADTLLVGEDVPSDFYPHFLTLNDSDPDGDSLSVTSVGTPSHGTITQAGSGWLYTPTANYNGSDSFTYTISDGHGETAQGTVNVIVEAVNDVPKFSLTTGGETQATKLLVPENTAGTITTVAATDGDGDAIQYSIGANPDGSYDNGSFTIDPNSGALKFTNPPDFEFIDVGNDDLFKVQVTASDGKGGSDFRDVWVQVTNVDDHVPTWTSVRASFTGLVWDSGYVSGPNAVSNPFGDKPDGMYRTEGYVSGYHYSEATNGLRYEYQGVMEYNVSGISAPITDAKLNLSGYTYEWSSFGGDNPSKTATVNLYASLGDGTLSLADWNGGAGAVLVGSAEIPNYYAAPTTSNKNVTFDLNEDVLNSLIVQANAQGKTLELNFQMDDADAIVITQPGTYGHTEPWGYVDYLAGTGLQLLI